VVPLEHLMQHDSVEEAAKAEPKQNTSRDGEAFRIAFGGVFGEIEGHAQPPDFESQRDG
jgi:hypothetical protein